VKELYTALMNAQAEYDEVILDKHNAYTGYYYASFESMVNATRPALKKHGLVLDQDICHPEFDRSAPYLKVVLFHTPSGQMKESYVKVEPEKMDKMGPLKCFGAATTYLQRYTLKTTLGLAFDGEDDLDAAPVSTPKKNFEKKPYIPTGNKLGDGQKKWLNDILTDHPEQKAVLKERYGSSDNMTDIDFQAFLVEMGIVK